MTTIQHAEAKLDGGETAAALKLFLEIAERERCAEDVYFALYRAAECKERLDHPEQSVIDAYLRAATAFPARAEALHGASRFCRRKGRAQEGFEFAARGLRIGMPTGGRFLQRWVHETGLLDEYAINAYWSGHYRECLDASLKLLASGRLPSGDIARVMTNARLAIQALPRDPDLGPRGAESFRSQHILWPDPPRRWRREEMPRVLVMIPPPERRSSSLPLYLDCIEALDYPKSSIVLFIPGAESANAALAEWVARVAGQYARIIRGPAGIAGTLGQPGHVRNLGLRSTLEHACDFCFVVGTDSFVRSSALGELVALDLPIVSPLLRSTDPADRYANFDADVDSNGFARRCDQDTWILNRWVRGTIEVSAVRDAYLIRADALRELTFQDETARPEEVVFSASARKRGVAQFVDNRRVHGYISRRTHGPIESDEDGIERARGRLDDARAREVVAQTQPIPVRRDNAVVSTQGSRPRALVFCTAFARSREIWDERYRRWLRAIQGSGLDHDAILIVDDGSPVAPDWHDFAFQDDKTPGIPAPAPKQVLHTFTERLGRAGEFDFPGWYRSFAFGGQYARTHGFEKVIHIESDAFLIGTRVIRYINDASVGWTALWCPRHGFPESAIQVFAGDAVGRLADIERTHPHARLVGQAYERWLPFDTVERRFVGDRYGDYLGFVPGNAEYAAQVPGGQEAGYYWWLPDGDARPSGAATPRPPE